MAEYPLRCPRWRARPSRSKLASVAYTFSMRLSKVFSRPPEAASRMPLVHRPGQINYGLFPFPEYNTIQGREGTHSIPCTEGYMRPAHNRYDVRINALDIIYHIDGVIKGHGNRGNTYNMRHKTLQHGFEHILAVRRDDKVEDFHLYPCPL